MLTKSTNIELAAYEQLGHFSFVSSSDNFQKNLDISTADIIEESLEQ